MKNQKQFQCPYKDINCDKLNTLLMKTSAPCTECNNYNDGVKITRTEKPELNSLSIGFITPSIESYRRFKENNCHHKVFLIDSSEAFHGLRFDTIIKGDDWNEVNKDVIEHAYIRLNKL